MFNLYNTVRYHLPGYNFQTKLCKELQHTAGAFLSIEPYPAHDGMTLGSGTTLPNHLLSGQSTCKFVTGKTLADSLNDFKA